MKILFDQGTPVPIRTHLSNHTVETAYERGWSDLKNGDLLTQAEADGFDINGGGVCAGFEVVYELLKGGRDIFIDIYRGPEYFGGALPAHKCRRVPCPAGLSKSQRYYRRARSDLSPL